MGKLSEVRDTLIEQAVSQYVDMPILEEPEIVYVEDRTPTRFRWQPQEDITTYELALCIPAFFWGGFGNGVRFIEGLPDNAQRHFIIEGEIKKAE